MTISGTILGNLPRKSNQRRIVTGPNGKPRVIKSTEALNYEQDFGWQIKRIYTGVPLQGDLYLTATVYYPSRRSDLSLELFQDLLEKAGVIENDRQFTKIFAIKKLDRENPRVEFTVGQVSDYT